MDKVFFKVVGATDTMYHSAIMDSRDLCLPYKIGKITEPKIGKLFAFIYYQDAVVFAGNENNYAILRGTGEICEEPFILHNRIPYFDASMTTLMNFWNLKKIDGNDSTLVPIGTVLLNWFKPTKLVMERE